MTDHTPIDPRELIAELALGVLDDHEAARVRAFLAEDAEAAAEYEEMQRVARVLPFAVQEREPSAGLRDGLMERISSEPVVLRPNRAAPGNARSFRSRYLLPIGAAAAVLVGLAGLSGFALGRGGGEDTELRAEADLQDRMLVAVANGQARTSSAEANGLRVSVVHASGNDEAYTVVEGLPALDSGKAYQVWFTRDLQSFEPGPVFKTSDGSLWLQARDGMESFVAMAFTVEDDRGVLQPSQAPFVVVPLDATAMR